MSNDAARDFLQSISGFTLDEGAPKSSADRPVRLATVHGGYAGTGPARVTFDGESTATTKAYVVMEPVAVADRVVLLPVGQGYVILGKLGGGAWYSSLVAADAAAAARLTALENRVQGVVPASVTVGSGSATPAADGTVAFAGCSSVSLNGAIAPGEYEVHVDVVGTAGATAILRMRTGSTDMVTATHAYTASRTLLTAGPTRSSSTAANGFGFISSTAAKTPSARGVVRLFVPIGASAVHALTTSGNAGGGDRERWDEYATTPSGTFDGVTLVISAGTGTGSIKIVKVR